MVAEQLRYRPQGRHFGHAPGMNDVYAQLFFIGLNQAAGHGRAADHERADTRNVTWILLEVVVEPVPDGRHAGGDGHPFRLDQICERGRLHMWTGHDQVCPCVHRRVGQAPSHGVELRHYRQDHIVLSQPYCSRLARPYGVQIHRTVTVERALGMACRATGVTEPHGLVLTLHPPAILIVRCRHQGLVIMDPARKFGRGRALLAVEEHEMVDPADLLAQAFHQRQQRCVDEDHLVLGMVDDVGQLIRKEANVEGVYDRACARRAEVEFNMLVVVPSKGADSVAGLHTQSFEHIAEPLHPTIEVTVRILVERAVRQFGLDLLVRIESIPVFQNAVNRELIVHHQAGKHTTAPWLSTIIIKPVGWGVLWKL